jgi:flagellar basal body-associated protein FliL
MDRSKTMMLIIIVLLILLLGTVVAVTVFLLGLVGDNNAYEFHEQAPPPIVQELRITEMEEVILGDRIVTNLAVSQDGTRGMVSTQVVVAVSVADEDAFNDFIPVLMNRIHFARAIALEVLGGQVYDDVRSVEGRQMTAELILHRLQEEFETNLLVRVFFSDWSQP